VAVAFGTKGAAASSAGSTSVPVDAPASLAANDMMVHAWMSKSATNTITGSPAGWATAGIQPDVGPDADATLIWSWKIAEAGDIGATFTWTMGTSAAWHSPGVLRYTVAGGMVPVLNTSGLAGDTASTVHVTAEITPSVNGCMLVGAWGMGSGSSTWTLDASLASRYNASLQSEPICVGDVIQTTAAAVTKTSNSSGGQDASMLLAAIVEAAGGEPPPGPTTVQQVAMQGARF
jgi:hypothetical protein